MIQDVCEGDGHPDYKHHHTFLSKHSEYARSLVFFIQARREDLFSLLAQQVQSVSGNTYLIARGSISPLLL